MLRQIVADVSQPGRRLWGAATSEEESRAYLQSRLTSLFKLMFWSFSALLIVLWVLYSSYDWEIGPRNNAWVFATFGVGLSTMLFLWQGVLVRRKLTFDQLHVIDNIYSTGCGLAIGGAAVISYDYRPSAYTCLCYACFTVLTRALVVPSTGRRTAIASTLAFVPTTIGCGLLAFSPLGDPEVPGPMYFSGFLMCAVVAVLLSAGGSRIIYGLNRKLSAAQQLGQYRLERKINQGGMGQVYLAHHVLLRRPTAVKRMLPGAQNIERFEREVQHMSQLTHPNTVAVFDYGRSPDGEFYYAMEYLGGGIDLAELVRRYGAQPAARVVHVLTQVCGALQEAHDANLIHRDIKPANIILCQRGGMPDFAKVVDFGLVKDINPDSGASSQMILGTPAYIAPEAVLDPSTIGPAVDIYALGCVGYELLTGKRVFEAKTAVALCMQHTSAVPRPPSELVPVPGALEAIILRCLAKQPAERYSSASALAEALQALELDGWDQARARRWWRDREPPAEDRVEDVPREETMTVDLGHRDTEQVLPW